MMKQKNRAFRFSLVETNMIFLSPILLDSVSDICAIKFGFSTDPF